MQSVWFHQSRTLNKGMEHLKSLERSLFFKRFGITHTECPADLVTHEVKFTIQILKVMKDPRI